MVRDEAGGVMGVIKVDVLRCGGEWWRIQTGGVDRIEPSLW